MYPTTTPTTVPAVYGAYSTQYATQYATQYSASVLSAIPYFPPFPHVPPPLPAPAVSPEVPELPPPPPDLTSITPPIAARVIQRMISAKLRDVGFDTAHPDAMKRLELEVVSFCQRLFQRAHEYANLSNRTGPIATDLLLASSEFNMPPEAFRKLTSNGGKKRSRKDPKAASAPTLLPAPSRSPSPELLSSDDEGVLKLPPPTLRMLPLYFPDLPPKHTYLRTPASPPKKAALPSLEKKLKTASLVQESLKNLMLATEDMTNQEEGELFGHIVNCELGAHPRKRWKVSKPKQ